MGLAGFAFPLVVVRAELRDDRTHLLHGEGRQHSDCLNGRLIRLGVQGFGRDNLPAQEKILASRVVIG